MPSTRTVSFRGERQRLRGYLAWPAEPADGPFPGVVIIHEAFGLNENMQDIARRFADEGYTAFAVDLFAGRNRAVCMARFVSGMLRGTPERFGIGDLKRALSVLSEQPSVDGERVGAIGFCMGGGFAIAWACTDDRLKAIAPFYAVNPPPPLGRLPILPRDRLLPGEGLHREIWSPARRGATASQHPEGYQGVQRCEALLLQRPGQELR